ncbi:EscU/YscU/HrcU family type III secretion system export apparatus switch protein [Halopseudomonas sp.]|jgi:flagellar biosynthetic protein FlhB|uniref:EscU/YscU/HrcU family type III secretion system export apparatus switch protein n=1 Tax=Halopseudomonas sp. TaxID=2901191 RepID=UPI0030012612
MADQQEKTEEASSFKLQEARKKGQVARSQELLSFAMVFAFVIAFSATAGSVATVVATHTHWWLLNANNLAVGWGGAFAQGGASLARLAYAFSPVVAALVVVAILTNLIFNGPVFSSAPLKPDFKRLNPIQGLKKIFSRRMLVDLLKVLIKGLLFGVALYAAFESILGPVLDLGTLSPRALPEVAKNLFVKIGIAILVVMAIAALFDIWYSRKEFGRQMRMSKHEQKEEYRRREGDPEIRSRRKAAQQEMMKNASALGSVKDADVVIVNPTHFAVALQFRPSVMNAPVVLAMGRDAFAKKICEVARGNRVPIMHRPPLARALHALSSVGGPIPDVMQRDVAKVYRWVIALPGNKVVNG